MVVKAIPQVWVSTRELGLVIRTFSNHFLLLRKVLPVPIEVGNNEAVQLGVRIYAKPNHSLGVV
jgi:hypothetical protein